MADEPGGFPRAEIESAFRNYLVCGIVEEDWEAWARCFTPDVAYHEHQLGSMFGRDAALVARGRTGEGQLVHTSLLRHGMYTISFDLNTALRFGVSIGVATHDTMANPMTAAGEGWIVNLSSATARPAPGPPFARPHIATMAIYGSSKAALNRLTNGMAIELWGTGIRVNTVEPRAAVMSEGAEAVAGDVITPDMVESMEAMVEGTVALCDCEPERTGGVYVSLDLIDELGLEVHALDGRGVAQP